MFYKQHAARTLNALLFAAVLTGCGASPTTGSYNSGYVSTDYNTPAQMAPVAVGQLPSAIVPTVTTPTTTVVPNLSDLTAAITAKTHKSVLLQKYSCTVTVSNSSNVTRTGKVVVSFLHGTKAEKGSPDQTQTVTVGPNDSKTLTFTDNKWHLLSETATVKVTTDPYSPGANPQ